MVTMVIRQQGQDINMNMLQIMMELTTTLDVTKVIRLVPISYAFKITIIFWSNAPDFSQIMLHM